MGPALFPPWLPCVVEHSGDFATAGEDESLGLIISNSDEIKNVSGSCNQLIGTAINSLAPLEPGT